MRLAYIVDAAGAVYETAVDPKEEKIEELRQRVEARGPGYRLVELGDKEVEIIDQEYTNWFFENALSLFLPEK